jgi:hypothetical protein
MMITPLRGYCSPSEAEESKHYRTPSEVEESEVEESIPYNFSSGSPTTL